MGTLYRNGIPYVGSGGAGGVEVTQAEYDALPTSEKMNGSIYFITDGSVSYPTASQMRYDNTESGIPSTSVQGAIDELKIEIGDTDISTIGDGTLSGAVSELNNGLIVPLMSNTEFHAVNQTIAQGSYYECPVDGFYSWAVYGGNNATAMLFLDSDNNITKAIYASDTDNANHIVSFPFKAGTKVYTRSSFGNYVVKGYWAL